MTGLIGSEWLLVTDSAKACSGRCDLLLSEPYSAQARNWIACSRA